RLHALHVRPQPLRRGRGHPLAGVAAGRHLPPPDDAVTFGVRWLATAFVSRALAPSTVSPRTVAAIVGTTAGPLHDRGQARGPAPTGFASPCRGRPPCLPWAGWVRREACFPTD